MRYKIFLMVLFGSMVVIDCVATNVQEIFLNANQLYQEEKYAKALQLYDSIEKKGPATWFNMGNCAFGLKKYVEAIIYWKRARKNSATYWLQAIDHNISHAYNKLGRVYTQGLMEKIYAQISLVSLFWLQLLFIICWFFFFICWFWLKKWRFGLLATLIVLNIVCTAVLFLKYRTVQYPLAIVKNNTVLFSGPDKDYHVMANINAADQVQVGQKDGRWYKVKYGSITGWVLSENIEIM